MEGNQSRVFNKCTPLERQLVLSSHMLQSEAEDVL